MVGCQTSVEKSGWIKDINDARDKQMEIEGNRKQFNVFDMSSGAKITFKLMKKEEERKLLQKMKTMDSIFDSSLQGSEMERIMMEAQKMQKVRR